RGKSSWLELASGEAVVGHLGMSGQMLVQSPGVPDEKHLRGRLHLDEHPGAPSELRFVDHRTFGGFLLDELVEVDGGMVPSSIAHIARDPMDPAFDLPRVACAIRVKRTYAMTRLLVKSTF